MKITISGTPASGKSTAAKLLAKRLGYKHYSMGDLQRNIANEKGIDIVELSKVESKDDSYDRMIDEKQVRIGKEKKDFVIDTWLGAKFIPDAFKVFIDAGLDIRAGRRLHHQRPEDDYDDLETIKAKMAEREKNNRERWIRYYGFDYTKESNYDLFIDSSRLSPKEVVSKILEHIKG